MELLLRYRGRDVTDSDAAFIRELVARHPGESRRGLSKRLCESWRWVQPNGAPRDMVCRGLMLALERGGHIQLPVHRRRPPNPLARRMKPRLVEVDQTPLCGGLGELSPLEFRQVRRTADEPLFNSLLEAHHYLGYVQPVGEHLKFLVCAGGRPVACFAWSSSPRHLAPRDRFIGWPATARLRNIRFLAYNTRFLILPWVQVRHLASHLLGRMARSVSSEWEKAYGHPLYLLETFVDPQRFAGTCYRASNWIPVGRTTGRGKADDTRRPNRSLKEVLAYPLVPDFRDRLRGAA
jgi:hypothetical protein